ncbi:hypothetical protein [Endozoicomonas sp. YOMI1]|uniref:hypothetical protein n=1 Tax=Endozoicomonas sp. YOMI1 TaxID=2828739 RepID=UPI0021485FEC|nr:hypothetical protein [Endozoicomonas sp. YOMI1]
MMPSGVQCFCNNIFFSSDIELKQHVKEKHLLPTFSCKSVSFFEKEREIPANSDFWEHTNRLELTKRICIELMDSDPKSADLPLDHIRRCIRLIQKEINTIKLNNNLSLHSIGLAEIENPKFLIFLGLNPVDIHNVLAIAYSGSCMHCTTTTSSDIDLYVITKNHGIEKDFCDFDLDSKKLSKKYKPRIHSTSSKFTKNTGNNIDVMICSLPVFIRLCLNSDSTALDLLHAGDELTLYESSKGFFSELKKHKDTFYSKYLPYVGFAKSLISKTKVINPAGLVSDKEQQDQLCNLIKILKAHYFDNLENILENIEGFDELIVRNVDNNQSYSIAGLKFDARIKVKRVIVPLEKQLEKIKGGMTNNKNLSIVARLITQLKELYINGDFEYPLPNSSFMINLKSEVCSDEDTKKMDEMIDEFLAQHKEWSEKSRFADSGDKDFWKKWLQEKGVGGSKKN